MAHQQQYGFSAVNKVATWSSGQVESWLHRRPRTISVTNVENDPLYRVQDIDILLVSRGSHEGEERRHTIEVKADQKGHKTGNLWLETISNVDLGTPGCFMYSQANHLYYHLVVTGQIYILDLDKTREWFKPRQNRFPTSRTRTLLAHGESYETEGRIVPIRSALAAVPAIMIVNDIPAIPQDLLQHGKPVTTRKV